VPSPLNNRTNRLIGQAMHKYNMLSDGDSILIAVSGGIDSLVLTWLLDHWRSKAPISYELLAIHLDMGFGSNEHLMVKKQLDLLTVPYLIEQTTFGKEALLAEDGKSGCYHCARQRRNRLFQLARDKKCNKIAFGHHQEDIIETFFLNLLYGGNLSTMIPRQDLFDGNLAIIRPLAFLEKDQIRQIGEQLKIRPVPNPCPLASHSKREEIRNILNNLFSLDHRTKSNIFAALGNVKTDYLL
jgi:tRNA 2-thiocytidine biosynthesis protein TtcA